MFQPTKIRIGILTDLPNILYCVVEGIVFSSNKIGIENKFGFEHKKHTNIFCSEYEKDVE